MRSFSWLLLALLVLALPGLAQQTNPTRELVRGYELRAVHGVPRVAAVAFSPEGDVLYAAGTDDVLRIFDTTDLAQVGAWDHKGASATFIAPSPDGLYVAIGDDDGTITVRDAATDAVLSAFEGGGRAIVGLAWDPAGARLGAAWIGGPIRTLDITTGRPVDALIEGPAEWFELATFSFAAGIVATSGANGDVRIVDLKTGRTRKVIRGEGEHVVELAFDPAGTTLAVGLSDGRTRIRNVADGALLRELAATARGGYAFSPDGKWLYRPGPDGGVAAVGPDGAADGLALPQRWTGLPLDEERDPALGETRARRATMAAGSNAAVSADGQYLAEAWGDELHLWHLRARKLVGRRDTGLAAISGVAFSPDGELVASSNRAGVVLVRESASGRIRGVLTLPKAPVEHMSWSPDGRFIAVAGPDIQVRVWEVLAARTARTLFGHETPVTDVRFSRGNVLASASRDGTVLLWDLEHRQSTAKLPGVAGGTARLAWAPDGKRLAAWAPAPARVDRDSSVGTPAPAPRTDAKPSSVALLDVAGRSARAIELVDLPGGAGVFSADGKRLYTAGEGAYALTVGTPPALVWKAPGHYQDLALTPDGRVLVAADRDGTIDLLDTATGELLRSFSGHTGRVTAVTVSANGAWIATGSDDGTVRVYER